MLTKRKALGKGLGALIKGADKKGGYTHCPIEHVIPGRLQPRRNFDEAKLKELADSIKEKGIIEPLLVRRKDDRYELIAGERRWRAGKLAGLREVPVIIIDASDEDSLELAIIENIQREDLNALEEAEAYRELMGRFSLSQEEVAKRVGKERATVSNYLRLLKLPLDVREALVKGSIAMGHARALLALDNHAKQRNILRKIVTRSLSVRETERMVKGYASETGRMRRTSGTSPLSSLETELKGLFGTKVSVKDKNGKGKIEVEFYSRDELDRLLEIFRSINYR